MKRPHRLPAVAFVLTASAAFGTMEHAARAEAGGGNGAIYGRIRDSGGRPAARVVVTAIGTRLHRPRTAVTNAGGAYALAALDPGSYRILFQRDGCTVAGPVDVRLHGGVRARLDVPIASTGCRQPLAEGPPATVLEPSPTAIADTLAGEHLAWLPRGAADDLLALAPFIAPASALLTIDGVLIERAGSAVQPGSVAGAVEEVEIRRAAGDASTRGAEGTVNLITRSASDRFAGRVRYAASDHRLQWSNLDASLRSQRAGTGRRTLRASEAEAEAGGPLVVGRARWWAAAGRTRSENGLIGFYRASCLDADGLPVAGASERLACLAPDLTITSTAHVKVEAAWHPVHATTIAWTWSSRENPSRGASAYTRQEATTRQHGLGHARPLAVRHRWTPTRPLAFETLGSYNDGGYALDFQTAGLERLQGAYDRYTLARWRSATASRHVRSTVQFEAGGSLYLPSGAGADHELEFGCEFLDAATHQTDRTGGGAVAVFDSRSGERRPWQARLLRDGDTRQTARTWSAFVQDAFRLGRITIHAGVRFDEQDDGALASTIAANPILPDLLPAVRFAGADSGVVYRDVSPRLGVAWDPAGRAGTLVKATAARYRATGNDTSSVLQPTGQTRLVYWWSDADGDGMVQRQELDLTRGLASTPSSNYDAAHPASVRTPATVDAGLKSVTTDAATLRLEQQVGRRLTLRAAYLARKTYRFQRAVRIGADGAAVRSDTFTPVVWMPAHCAEGAECPAVVYYERETALPSGTRLGNDGEYTWRHAVEFSAHKRLSNGWMLDASLALNRASWHAPVPTRDYTDPTNIAMRDGTEYSTSEPRWVGRMAATVRLPRSLGVAALLTGRQGEVFDRVVSSPGRGALGSTRVGVKRFGLERYPDVWRLDCRVDWKHRLGPLAIVPTLTVINALNANTVLARNRVQNSGTANAVTDLAAPRSLHLEIAASW